jgi:hypothetical protein
MTDCVPVSECGATMLQAPLNRIGLIQRQSTIAIDRPQGGRQVANHHTRWLKNGEHAANALHDPAPALPKE